MSKEQNNRTSADSNLQQFGRFQILDTLGTGSFSVVYRAHDPQVDRQVALKVPRLGTLRSQEEEQRFLREARSAARLRHPQIVTVYEADHVDGTPYLVMELLSGKTLRELLKGGSKLKPVETVSLIRSLTDVVHYAHTEKVIHRDLKPENVIIDDQRIPHVLDFGTARHLDSDLNLTRDGISLGTPSYMAPELHSGNSRSADPRTDIWSLGVMLYELLAGTLPFQGEDELSIAVSICTQEPPALKKLPGVTRGLRAICFQCLRKSPDERYSTCTELSEDLSRWLNNKTTRAQSSRRARNLRNWSQLPRIAYIAGGTILLVALALSVLLWRSHLPKTEVVERAAEGEPQLTSQQSVIETESQLSMEEVLDSETLATPEKAEVSSITPTSNVANSTAKTNEVKSSPQNTPSSEVTTIVPLKLPSEIEQKPEAETSDFWNPSTRHFGYLNRVGQAKEQFALGNKSEVIQLLDSCAESERNWEWYYLRGQLKQTNITTWQLGQGNITSMAFSPVGNKIAAASEDGIASICDASSGRSLESIVGQESPITAMAFNADGSLLAVACQDNTIRLLDFSSHRTARFVKDVSSKITSLIFHPELPHFAMGQEDGLVTLIETPTGETSKLLGKLSGPVRGIAYFDEGQRLFAGGDDPTQEIWDLSGKDSEKLSTGSSVRAVVASPEGSYIAIAGVDNLIRVLDANTLEVRFTLRGHTSLVTSLAASPKGTRIVSGSHDGTVKLWDVRVGTEVLSLSNGRQPIKTVAVDSMWHRIAAGSQDGSITVWSIE